MEENEQDLRLEETKFHLVTTVTKQNFVSSIEESKILFVSSTKFRFITVHYWKSVNSYIIENILIITSNFLISIVVVKIC